MSSPEHLEIIPLGGLGEFGMNLMVYRHADRCLIVDCGLMFPGAEHIGVEVVIPDMAFLEECGEVAGVVLTHGHEDHIGALPFLLARLEVPVYGTPLTLGLVRRRLREHELARKPGLRELPADGGRLRLGPFEIETLPVAHSIPQAVLLVVRTPVGTVIHTADFKLDPLPVDGVGLDLSRLSRVGDEGVLALLSDSTNAERKGFTPGEASLRPSLDAIIGGSERRVFATTFASNLHRVQQLIDLAVRHRRKVALVGSSLLANADVAVPLGLLRFPAGTRIDPEEAMNLAPERVLMLVTGSQGEPMSALARIAVDRHRDVSIDEGDLVIHSARIIPGNEKSIQRMINHLLRRGAEVVTEAEAPVHVSGHPSREELRLVLNLARPRFLVPIHGEYRQLKAHASLGAEAGLEGDRTILAESGDVVGLSAKECAVVDRVRVGQVFIDAALDEVDPSVLVDRRKIAGDGVVVPVVAVDRKDSTRGGTLEIVSRGFNPGAEEDEILDEAKRLAARVLAEASLEERTDEGLLKARLQTELKRFIRKRTQRRPLIVPVIVEL